MKHTFRSILSRTKSLFLHGFFTLLPIIITFKVVRFFLRLLKSMLAPVYAIEPAWLKQIPQSEIIFTIIIIFILGLIFDFLLHDPLHNLEQKFLNRIPLLRKIYFGSKQLVKALNPKDTVTFKTVVMIEFPRPGAYTIGFLVNEVDPQFCPGLTGTYNNIFVPTVPNPATGHYLVVPADQCRVLNISREDALQLVISGGIIQPK